LDTCGDFNIEPLKNIGVGNPEKIKRNCLIVGMPKVIF